MANPLIPPKHDLVDLSRTLFERAKRGWVASFLCRLVVVGITVAGLFVSSPTFVYGSSLVVAFGAIVAELLLWWSDSEKGTAEALRRSLDFRDSFGWPISPSELSDLLVRVPRKLRKNIQGAEELYFASQQGPGPEGAVENVQESAWWSKHLTARMVFWCLAGTAALGIGSLLVLLVSIGTATGVNILITVARIVMSVISLVASFGLLRLTAGYYNFSKRATAVENRAGTLLNAGGITEVQAIKLWQEYHLARAVAPPIPSWLWGAMRTDLTSMWEDYRRVP